MSRRELVLTVAGVFAIALIVRVVAAAQIVFPKPEDTAYYVGVARNVLEGRGLVSDALWSYQTPPLIPGRDAFEVWMPLPTFLALVPMAIFGASFAAAQVSSVLVGAVVPVLAWRLAADVAEERGLPTGRARAFALGTGLTTALYLPLLLFSALPDSTMPFTALVLAACLLMTRIVRDPRGASLVDPRLIALGVVLGLAALARNETAWLALIWAGMAWFTVAASAAVRVRLVAVVAVAALVVFAPWAIRNIAVLGSPLPSQAAANAVYLSGFDIFAWNDPPTLSRYLAVGPARLLELRVEGTSHNLVNVLLLLGIPVSAVGILALPWQARGTSLRPLLWLSLIIFLFTSLVFPAATQWGTFLHASGPVFVLLVLTALLALDAGIARLATRLRWERPVAWLAGTVGVFGSALFSLVLLPVFGAGSVATSQTFDALGERMAAIGRPLTRDAGPVISNFPIWMAETQRIHALALPNEPPTDVLDMVDAFPGTRLMILVEPDNPHWPSDLLAGAPGSECFHELELGPAQDPSRPDPLEDVSVYEIACP